MFPKAGIFKHQRLAKRFLDERFRTGREMDKAVVEKIFVGIPWMGDRGGDCEQAVGEVGPRLVTYIFVYDTRSENGGKKE
jgi:hypothetical protein